MLLWNLPGNKIGMQLLGAAFSEKRKGRNMIRFAHFNFNVLDLEKSLRFYDDALGLKPIREKELSNAKIVFVGNDTSDFILELTQLHNRTKPYDLGECEFHLAFVTDRYDEFHAKHKDMGIIEYENDEAGIYFITDPDGYWIEIVPERTA